MRRNLRVTGAILLVGLGALFAVIGVSAAATYLTDRPIEEFPAWLEAFSTSAAFVAAAIAVVFAVRAFRLETERDDRAEELRRQEQASGVACWNGTKANEDASSALRRAAWKAVQQPGIYIRNASGLPVTNVSLAFFLDGMAVVSQYVGVIPPSSDPLFIGFNQASREVLDRVNEGRTWKHPNARMWFTDASGTIWLREQDGSLIEPFGNGIEGYRTVVVDIPNHPRADPPAPAVDEPTDQ